MNKTYFYLVFLIIKSLVLLFKRKKPSTIKMLLSEIMILRQQLLVLERLNKKRIVFSAKERLSMGFWATVGDDKRIFERASIIFSPVTLLKLHRNLVNNKYGRLYGSKNKKRGAKGKSPDLVNLFLSIKRNNPDYGIEKIEGLLRERGQVISDTTILRILRKHGLVGDLNKLGPSWLSFIGNSFNGIWSVDMFKVESAFLSSYVVMVAIDIYSRKIINFSVRRYPVDGGVVCQMFQEICKKKVLPKKISTDNDPLFLYKQWSANLRIDEIEEIKSVPYAPVSHPFIERVIGTTRREFIDKTLFFTRRDLDVKLNNFKRYYNEGRVHSGVDFLTPSEKSGEKRKRKIDLNKIHWDSYCNGMFKVPISA